MTSVKTLERRVKQLEARAAHQYRRSSPDGALDAFKIGEGTQADLEIIYPFCEAMIKDRLVERAVKRAVMPSVAKCVAWDWIAHILSCPPGAVVPDHYRRELALCAADSNPYELMRSQPTRYPKKLRDNNVLRWVTAQLSVMVFERHDELDLRAEVAAQVPTDPTDVAAFLQRWREESEAHQGAATL